MAFVIYERLFEKSGVQPEPQKFPHNLWDDYAEIYLLTDYSRRLG
jgi:hypothetical protein